MSFLDNLENNLKSLESTEQGREGAVFKQTWPAYSAELARETEIEIPVQINGKIRARVVVVPGLDQAALEAAVMAYAKVNAQVDGKTIVKIEAVPGKLVNIVVK